MNLPKWIERIEDRDQDQEGYWVKCGRDEAAQSKTRSKSDTIAVDEIEETGGQRLVPVGGSAYAGLRSISRTGQRIDNGDWVEAEIEIEKALSETTWVIWRYDWPFQPGAHELEVHCFDANERPQISRRKPPHSSGATGIHYMKIVM
jgi:hypothetical protein